MRGGKPLQETDAADEWAPLRRGQRVQVTWGTRCTSAAYCGRVVDTQWIVGGSKRTVLTYQVQYDDGDLVWHHHGIEQVEVL